MAPMAENRVPEGSIRSVATERIRSGRRLEELDALVVEAPLEIRFAGRPFTVLMRTPGDDEELVRGFLFTEGIARRDADVEAVERPRELLPEECANLIDVRLAPGLAAAAGERSFYASASCGVCGKSSIADLAIDAPAVVSDLRVEAARLARMPERLRERQEVFRRTGALHAAALFTPGGELVELREDVGRHNAVDKLVGWALGAGRLPLDDLLLIVSGRIGFEIVQKAIVAAVPVVGAVGAASTLAVDLAERFGLTLASFVGSGGMNLFGARQRVVGAL